MSIFCCCVRSRAFSIELDGAELGGALSFISNKGSKKKGVRFFDNASLDTAIVNWENAITSYADVRIQNYI